jgi:hypothetical protein
MIATRMRTVRQVDAGPGSSQRLRAAPPPVWSHGGTCEGQGPVIHGAPMSSASTGLGVVDSTSPPIGGSAWKTNIVYG